MKKKIRCEDIKQKNIKKNVKKERRNKYKLLIISCFLGMIIRICSYFILNVLEGETHEYINTLMNLEYTDESNKEIYAENIKEKTFIENRKKHKDELIQHYQQNKRNAKFKQFFKNDAMQYSFTSEIYNFKYLYDSYILSRLYKNVYFSLTVRINPLLLKVLHLLIFKKIKNVNNSFFKILNNHEFRYYIFIALIDLLISIFLFLIVERLSKWEWHFLNINNANSIKGNKKEKEENEGEDCNEPNVVYTTLQKWNAKQTRQRVHIERVEKMEKEKGYNEKENNISNVSYDHESDVINNEERWCLINPFLLLNLYLNNPLTILSNVFLSLDNLKLLIITLSIYFTVKRINGYSYKIFSLFNLLTIILLNATLLYVSSFHFILPIVGINYFIIYLEDDIKTHHIKTEVPLKKVLRLLVKNGILLITTLMVYLALLVASAHFNENSLFFLNNTVVNEYKLMFILPNLGNYWYIFSLMFREYYYSYLFLFHFHIFIYSIPLMFRLMKTPLIYLQILEVIALLFHPNITVVDILYSILLLCIDYKNAMASTPLSKLLIVFLSHLGLYYVAVNLWLRKNTGNPNYVFFNQLIIFNVAVIIANNSIKRYVRIQTPGEQLADRTRIVVSEETKVNNPVSKIFKKLFA